MSVFLKTIYFIKFIDSNVLLATR